MRFFPFAAVLALLFFASYSFAASPLQLFLSYLFEPDAAVTYSPLLCDGNYYLVSSGGRETYVMDGSNGSTIQELPLLTAMLKQDAQNRTSYEPKISSSILLPSLVNAAKETNETKCLQYIGDDGDPGCNDRQSCLASCFSVPQCDLIVHSDGFLEAVMDWDFKRKDFSSILGAYSDGIDSIRFDPSAIDGKISLLSNLSFLAKNMSQNSIFLSRTDDSCSGKNASLRCYDYCPKIDYSGSLISAQSQELSDLKAALSIIAIQGSRAEAILNQSMENDAYLSSRGKDYEDFRIRMKNDIRALKATSVELAKTVTDPQIASSISRLENISAQAKNYSDSGHYKKALALRPQFYSISNATFEQADSDSAQYASLALEMEKFSEKLKNSAWLIGNASVSYYSANLSALKANYTAPLSPDQISDASAMLSELNAALDAEIALKAVQIGNSSSTPEVPDVQSPRRLPEYAWVAAIPPLAFIAYLFYLRYAKRLPPRASL